MIESAITQARITHSGTRFFQFTSLKLQKGTFDTMVMPANTAIAQATAPSQVDSSGSKPKSVSTQTSPAITAAPEGLGRPWKQRLSTTVVLALQPARRIPRPAQLVKAPIQPSAVTSFSPQAEATRPGAAPNPTMSARE